MINFFDVVEHHSVQSSRMIRILRRRIFCSNPANTTLPRSLENMEIHTNVCKNSGCCDRTTNILDGLALAPDCVREASDCEASDCAASDCEASDCEENDYVP